MSLLSMLSIGGQSLLSTQRGINSVNKNISNVATEGYNREIAVFQDMPRSGVFVNKILRVFDQFLFTRQVNLGQSLNSDKAYSDILSSIENIFNDINGTGFSQDLNQFFNSINDMLVNPNDLSARQQFLANAQTLIGKIRNSYQSLQDLKQQTTLKVKDQIDQINQITQQIAKLNNDIKTKVMDVEANSDYLNERDRLISQLSNLIDTKVVFNPDNTVNIYTAKGFGLVVGIQQTQLNFETDSNGNPVVKWNNSNDITGDIQNGEVGGNLKGIGDINKQINNLNDFTTVFATVFNKVHRQGYNLNGNNNVDFFKIDPSSSLTKIDASNISLNITDPKDVALATDPNYLNSDNTNGKALLNLKNSISGVLTPAEEGSLNLNDSTNYNLIKSRGFFEFYNSKLVAEVSSKASTIQTQKANNQALYDAVTQKIQSLSGVNLDEELINLTKLQRAYQANARVITVADELFQTILNIGK
ncbi:MAG: flagellar hook-associated protein FlgK [Hydrogenothermaceae bacterium]|nr:flagellar hook-associated protein FlgK [Hydrogenothermaceae bacterium]